MAAYVEGSVRLRCIDRTRRRLGVEEPDLWAIQSILSLDGSGRAMLADVMSLSSDDNQIRRQLASLGERIGLKPIIQNWHADAVGAVALYPHGQPAQNLGLLNRETRRRTGVIRVFLYFSTASPMFLFSDLREISRD